MIEDLWYKNAIVYSLDVDAFMDANGDGCGDFEGLIRHLDYLEALGVDAIWVMPFQPSPNKDNGYDVRDFYGVDPRHGSPGDFVEFVHQAKKRGFKVLMDLVINHTSEDHPWFQEARRDPRSPFRDWYIWSKERPANWDQGMVFPGYQRSTWTYDRVAKLWYYHRFYPHQPDLNMDEPAVRDEVRRVIGYWLQLGVDGFRVDAVPFILEASPHGGVPGEMRFDYLEELRSFSQWRLGDSVLLGEANVLPKDTAPYFADGRGIQMMFNFWVNQHLFLALATGDVRPLADALEATRALPPACQWAHFLRNHDELDLGRLTEEQRAATFARFGPDPSMQLYGRGLRRRLAPMLGNRAQIELAYSLLLSLPGTPVIRYGDEIGMGEDLSQPERESVRTPMQWSSGRNAGFSTADRLVRPLVPDGPYGPAHVNVEKQRRDPTSLFRWTTRMLWTRKEAPEIGWGRWSILPAAPGVLAMLYEWRGTEVLVVHNLAGEPREVALRLPGDGVRGRLVNLLAPDEIRPLEGRYPLSVEAYGYRWFRVGEPDPGLDRGTEPSLRGKGRPTARGRRPTGTPTPPAPPGRRPPRPAGSSAPSWRARAPRCAPGRARRRCRARRRRRGSAPRGCAGGRGRRARRSAGRRRRSSPGCGRPGPGRACCRRWP